MDTLKPVLLSAVVALAVVFGFSAISKDGVGGVPGVSILPVSQSPDAYMILSTSTPTNSTLVTADIDQESFIEHTLTQADGTLTFPASSSFPGIPNTGDMRTIWVRSATTTAGIDLTIAVGTGMTLKRAASSTVLLIGDTDGDNTARLDFVRKADSDINVYLHKFED
jgi:hypothetical protein